MSARERFPISELVGRSGVPPATVRHYLRLGLLPAPRRVAGNRFLYDERHVQRLRLIRILRRRRGLSLAMIRRVLPGLLGLDQDQAFRPEMWDRVISPHLRAARRRAPGTRLLDAAREAFARRGYGDVNVDEICRVARIAKGSFYRHYRSKEELFFEAARSAGADVGAALADAAPASEDRAAEILADALEPYLPIFLDLLSRAIQRRPGYPTVVREVTGALSTEIARHTADPQAGGRVLERGVARAIRGVLRPGVLSPENLPREA